MLNQTFKRQNLESIKRKGTYHVKKILNKLLRDFLSQTLETRRQWAPYSECCKEKTINQESYFWQTCSSEVREKLRHFQINKSWGSSLPLDLTLARNAGESPAGKNEGTLNTVKAWRNEDHSRSETRQFTSRYYWNSGFNSTFCFLHYLRD